MCTSVQVNCYKKIALSQSFTTSNRIDMRSIVSSAILNFPFAVVNILFEKHDLYHAWIY